MAEQCAMARRFSDSKARVLLNAVLPGRRPEEITPGRMRDELRRPSLRGLIERLPRTHRHRLTGKGPRTALFHMRVGPRLLRPAMASLIPSPLSDLAANLRCVQAALSIPGPARLILPRLEDSTRSIQTWVVQRIEFISQDRGTTIAVRLRPLTFGCIVFTPERWINTGDAVR